MYSGEAKEREADFVFSTNISIALEFNSVIFDIDNTLVPHGAPADERAISLFKELKALGFNCMLLSNNKEPRVKMFNDVVQVNYIYNAGKPLPKNYIVY